MASNSINDSNGSRTERANGYHPPQGSTNGPLTILIAGAGIGGLTAALALRQQGHIVKIYEQSRFAAELGAAVHLAPNCNGVLRRLGIFAEKFGSNPMNRLTEADDQGNVVRSPDLREANKIWQHPWHLAHRVHLHETLKRAAISQEGSGVPAELHTASRIGSVDEVEGTITLEKGEVIRGDVVIGADGVHSVSRNRIAPETKPFSCGKSAFRFLIAREAIKSDPQTTHLVEEEGELKMWYGHDRRIVMYPTSNNQLLNFVCIHPAAESNASSGWNTEASLETMLKVYGNFEPSLIALIAKADPKTLKVWTLLDMDEIPIWSKEKLALIGDAAHPFLPHQGQGAGAAIEDAAALSVVLPFGTSKEDIPERLRLYDTLRHERATKIQNFSRIIGGDDLLKKKEVNIQSFTLYNFGHDEFDSANQKFREYLWSKIPYKYSRMPIAFGPMPGPRQTHYGQARPGVHSTFTTASIRFKTSRTLLQNLFPPGKAGYRFKDPAGTIAYASFRQITFNKMDWLGGGGYSHLGLYIHGVEYTHPETGKTVNGTYMPILFENLADPILSGREELGMPKVYSGIDVFRRGEAGYHIRTSWQGVNWGSFSLSDLKLLDPSVSASAVPDDGDGILVHRYMPSVGKENKAKAEADYACFDAFAETEPKPKVFKSWEAGSAKLEIDGGDWASLPTLHHVVGRLAEIPIYEVVEARVVEGAGVSDVAGCTRV
ncbi:FAD binding domain-containing [Lecanosticta acicola]|uniref:FAD binding domain-containing n=1 Tax=Lecanosticta acicola TaxID=111012 RepID=A0AAI8Z0V1_9PEZI|nr:FAD binding domain-containing [Lecanosticta acicola]